MTAPLTRHAVWRHTGLLAAKRDPNLTEVYVRDVSLGYQSSCSELCQEPEAEAQSRQLWKGHDVQCLLNFLMRRRRLFADRCLGMQALRNDFLFAPESAFGRLRSL